MYNSKDTFSFFSGRWNTGTSPDLAFLSADLDSLQLDRRTSGKLPKFQHRPLLIMVSKNLTPVPSEPYRRWNFRKANWEQYSLITNKLSQDLLPPDTSSVDEAYEDFCSTIFAAAEISITRGRKNNYRPRWDEECEQDRVKQPARLHQPCFLDLTKNEKIACLKLSISSTSRTPGGWNGIQSTT